MLISQIIPNTKNGGEVFEKFLIEFTQPVAVGNLTSSSVTLPTTENCSKILVNFFSHFRWSLRNQLTRFFGNLSLELNLKFAFFSLRYQMMNFEGKLSSESRFGRIHSVAFLPKKKRERNNETKHCSFMTELYTRDQSCAQSFYGRRSWSGVRSRHGLLQPIIIVSLPKSLGN